MPVVTEDIGLPGSIPAAESNRRDITITMTS